MRLKVDYQKSVSDFDDPVLCHQWCRVGLVCDSPIKDVKYLLEITKDGVEEWELFSRLLMLKSQKKTLGYKQLNSNLQLSPDTLQKLDWTRKELKNKFWDSIMKLIESDEAMKYRELIDIYVEATLQTKHITSALHDDSFLYNSLFKVFTVFVQELDDDDEDPELMAAPEIKHDDVDGDGSM